VHGGVGHPRLRRFCADPRGIGTGASDAGRIASFLVQISRAPLLSHPLHHNIKTNNH
jgi:hypothetical protein